MAGRWCFPRTAMEYGTFTGERSTEPAPSSVFPKATYDTIRSRSLLTGPALVLGEVSEAGSVDFAVLNLDGEPRVEPLLETDFDVTNAHLSSDGRWLAYQSNVSGVFEVYVRPFPDVDSGRWQISSGGGTYPLWGADGHELFFRTFNGLMRVAIETEPTFLPGKPGDFIKSDAYYMNPFARSFDISPDGQRFLMIKEDAGSDADDPYAGTTRLILVQNWFESF